MLQGMRTTVSPADGPVLLLFAFEAVIIGGMGSFWGTLAGALLLGVTQQIGFRLDPGWGIWFGHLVFLAVLVLRPQGLFPRTALAVPHATVEPMPVAAPADAHARANAPVRVTRGTRASTAALAAGVTLVAAAATLPWWAPASTPPAGCATSSRSRATSCSR
jgi:predicted lipid-binding transport protein (Tim44 family)